VATYLKQATHEQTCRPDLEKRRTAARGFQRERIPQSHPAIHHPAPPGLRVAAHLRGGAGKIRRHQVDKLAEKNRLYGVVKNFAETDLRDKNENGQPVVTNHDMGQAFEELLRKFNDVSPAGEQYTPRDVIELMVTILFGGDEEALSVSNEKGDVLSDSDLRDAEYVPLHEDIDRYFAREVLPHWPDAWVNTEVTDERDGLTGVVGTEINFNREFYVYKPPRSRSEILGEIEAMEKRFMDMLHGVKG